MRQASAVTGEKEKELWKCEMEVIGRVGGEMKRRVGRVGGERKLKMRRCNKVALAMSKGLVRVRD